MEEKERIYNTRSPKKYSLDNFDTITTPIYNKLNF